MLSENAGRADFLWVIYGGRTFWPQGIMGTIVELERREDLSQALAAKPHRPFLYSHRGL